ncbi:hypothetical protein AX14_013123 [Amanita brunnescens Koide BX004]|nr:hypothetical protein AX14_013123 [Amanita brunnescens Koide BX004]
MRTVLVFHGYTQNLGALRKECGKDIELVFVDAPVVLQPADLNGLSAQNTAQQTVLAELGAAEASATTDDPALTPRAWWKSNKERTVFTGMEDSILMIRDVLKQRKFDGVLGFSQGAAFAAVIAALLERPHLYPPFLVDGEPPHPPLEFCVAISGYKPGGYICDKIFSPSYSTPTLHILGKTDVVVVEERSRALIAVSSGKRVEEHTGGHFVPSNGRWRKFLSAYMKDHRTDIPSPGSSGSGAATPLRVGDAETLTPALLRMTPIKPIAVTYATSHANRVSGNCPSFSLYIELTSCDCIKCLCYVVEASAKSIIRTMDSHEATATSPISVALACRARTT